MNQKVRKILIPIIIVIAGLVIAGAVIYQKQKGAGKQIVIEVKEKELARVQQPQPKKSTCQDIKKMKNLSWKPLWSANVPMVCKCREF